MILIFHFVIGRNNLEAIEISDVDANLKPIKGTEKIIECDTLLLSIGLYPFNALLKQAGCEVNPRTKGSKVNQNLETSIKGIYSCGNVLHVHDLVDFVSEEAETVMALAGDVTQQADNIYNMF